MHEFHRVRRLPPYVFEQVNKLKAKARAAGADIVDLGMGNPDLPAPKHVIDKLVETAGKPRTDRYSASKGIAGLRKAQAGYYGRRFGVKLDPETQVVVTLGSKEGFANIAAAITAPGDVVLTPNPSYPIHAFGFLMAGGVIRSVPAEPTPELFHALERAIQHSIPKPIAVVVCYPSNPTATTTSLDFYKDLVIFARKHEIFVLSDLAYAEVYFDDNSPPPSVLQAPGAFDVAVEFTSMSKTFSMAGWRMGFAVGNERLLAALARVKSYLDYGAYTPIQVAAAAALNGPDDCIKVMRATYKRRRDVMIESFGAAGWNIERPSASMFAWTPVPEKFRHLGSLEFSKLLIEKADVAVAPGIGFGEHGDGYVRLALVENEQRIRQAARGVKRFFERADETLHNVVQLKQKA
ncbi:MAG: LL-diaminopimelate aminotransferase [Roseiarcus sp.]